MQESRIEEITRGERGNLGEHGGGERIRGWRGGGGEGKWFGFGFISDLEGQVDLSGPAFCGISFILEPERPVFVSGGRLRCGIRRRVDGRASLDQEVTRTLHLNPFEKQQLIGQSALSGGAVERLGVCLGRRSRAGSG